MLRKLNLVKREVWMTRMSYTFQIPELLKILPLLRIHSLLHDQHLLFSLIIDLEPNMILKQHNFKEKEFLILEVLCKFLQSLVLFIIDQTYLCNKHLNMRYPHPLQLDYLQTSHFMDMKRPLLDISQSFLINFQVPSKTIRKLKEWLKRMHHGDLGTFKAFHLRTIKQLCLFSISKQ